MRCQRCRTPMAQTRDDRALTLTHSCACGRSVVTRDPGCAQRPGTYRPPVPFKSLELEEQEKGWEQEFAPDVDPPKRRSPLYSLAQQRRKEAAA